MASRHRTCHHLIPSAHIAMPNPQLLLTLAPVMGTLMEAASEYDSLDPIPTSIVEWVRWLDVEVQTAVTNRVEPGPWTR